MDINHGIADPNHKTARCAFALTIDQHETLRSACRRLGWTQSQFLRHAAIITANSVLASPSLADGGVLKAIVPPAHAVLDGDDS